ncbi:MAG TPA: M67 family metallopeptidase [Saprospiraceae bacterium]|nr:M67 family metallopeptidase [Saprospiraceae bacterium]
MKTVIKISNRIIKELIQDAESSYPNEACGFLYGADASIRSIVHFEPVINSQEGDQRRRFEISTLDYLKTERRALDTGLDLLGIYHSHPDHEAIASSHDLEKALPFFSYVIVSVLKGKAEQIYSWRLFDRYRSFYQEELLIENLIISPNK